MRRRACTLLTTALLAAGGPEPALIGTARRAYRPGGSLRVHGVCREPVIAATGYGGVVTHLVSEDGRWLIITSSERTDARYEITLIDLTRPDAAPRHLITGLENDWSYLGNSGTTFYWRTNKDAPRQRIVFRNFGQFSGQVNLLH